MQNKSEVTERNSQCNLIREYSIRVSARARYIRLNVSLGKGVVVVVPKSMSQRQVNKLVPEFVREKQQWIHSTIEKLRSQKPFFRTIEQCLLPEQIALTAIGQTFTIDYYHDLLSPMSLEQQGDFSLKISGDLENKTTGFYLLERYFKDYARFYLKQRLDELSQKFALPYNRLTIRAQKTRWGSCSAKKNINLNYRLLFINDDLLDYILLHELMHTIHMNHSKAFWTALASLMPDARKRDKAVNQAGKTLPCWIYYK